MRFPYAEIFSRKIWRLFGENPYLCAKKHRGLSSATDRPRKTNNESCKAPRTLQTEGLNFCNHIMSDLNKKVQNAIKIMKIAAEDAANRESKQIQVNTYGGVFD